MGLDSIEILMKVEQTFDIKIPGEQAQQIRTVGDFHNAAWRHLSGKQIDQCQSQKLFYSLRKSFTERYKFPSEHLSPATSPNEIFPGVNRRQEYLKFSADTMLKLPDLVLGSFWQTFLTSFGFAAIAGGLATSLILVNFFDYSKWTLLVPVAGAVVTTVFSGLLEPKRIVIKQGTMRAFINQTLVLNYSRLVVDGKTNRAEMESVINHIIADHAGLEPEEITADKKIGDDLGID